MKTITKIMFGLFLLYIESNINAQTININSISNARQTGGYNGYTLDGQFMVDSRAKLLNQNNFGTSGIYPKSINIIDGYATSGSLTQISTVPINQIFFFGAFDLTNPTTQQFTTAEIDSLYNWSKRGGKLIIGASAKYATGYDPSVLNSKWGFDIILNSPNSFVPTTNGNNTDIFNGPFGTVFSANQGGGAQGYFDLMPTNSVVLAINGNGSPTLFMDCNTLDLIIADVDGYTSLGGITAGDSINNSQDRFWVNTIAFMDKLQPLPQITNNTNSLSIDSIYIGYQWYLDGNPIPNATSPTYNLAVSGYYQVEVIFNGGCSVKSDSTNIILNTKEIVKNNSIYIYPNPSI